MVQRKRNDGAVMDKNPFANPTKRKPPPAKESSVVNRILTYLHSNNLGVFWKTHGGAYGRAGISDIIGCYKGRFVALEVKNAKGKATAIQLYFLDQVYAAGGVGGVVRCVDDVKKIIESIDLE